MTHKRKRKTALTILGPVFRLTLLTVTGVLLIVFFTQRRLMYYPPRVPFDPQTIGDQILQRVSLSAQDGVLLHHWYVKPARNGNPTFIYFQGNAQGLDNRAYKYRPWIDKGYGVFLVGYPGYGNLGTPTEATLYEAARQAVSFVLEDQKIAPSSIILYGESLGTGVATQMAVEFPSLGALILEAPFTSYADVGAVHYPYLPVHLLALDRYETIDKITSIKMPLLVIHGRSDHVVPFAEGEAVYKAAPEPKKAAFFEEADHGNLYDYGADVAVDNFINMYFPADSF